MMLRDVRHQDADEIVALARELHSESVYARLPFSEGRCRALITMSVERDKYYARVVEYRGRLIGGLCGELMPFYICDGVFAQDITFFVTKSVRHRGIACVTLIRDFVQWGYARGAEEIVMGFSTGIDDEGAGALLEKLGFNKVGSIYKRGV